MSLETDGIWLAGVWATTVWASGVWREGEYTGSTYSGNMVLNLIETTRVKIGQTITDIDADWE